MLAQAEVRKRSRSPGPGLLVGGPIFEFYAERKKVAKTTMLVASNSSGGKSGFIIGGAFDTNRWCDYVGLCWSEYEAFEKSCAMYRTGRDPAVKIEVLDKILTNLGRPDLFALWYGGEEFPGEKVA